MKARRKVRSYVIEGGTVTCMYSDEDRALLGKTGKIIRAEKISDLRFNPTRQKWEAVDRKTKKVIASDATRKGCVRKEHDHYERMIARGVIPWER